MLANAHMNIRRAQATQHMYYIVKTFNNPFSVGNKVLKTNLAYESQKAKMK